jgi:F0F1-type ATP synthase membrane subunit b/b'
MTNFGIIKSKIEDVLLESYKNNTFKQEFKNFKKLVLENKKICKLFYLYDDLTSNKGLSDSIVNDYVNECITIYENTVNKIQESDITPLKSWIKNSKVVNQYNNIDNLFSRDVLTIESRINSKKHISESLKKLPTKKVDTVQISLTSMVNVANKTISNFIDSLTESDKKELTRLLSEDDVTLNQKFDNVKESVVNKLTEMKNNNEDKSTQSRIDETLDKVISEKYDKLTYFKLKSLNENL